MKTPQSNKTKNQDAALNTSEQMLAGRLRPMLAGLAIAALTVIVYIPAMRAGFIWDDNTFLTDNQLIKAADGLYRFWFTTEPPDYFPLTSTMLWVEWRLWGMNATGYHIVNVLLHAVSAVLVWRVLGRLKIPGAWLAGLIFGIHPVNVESVAWITERKNTLPMMFYLATILLYMRSDIRPRNSWYALAIIAFLLALLSKTSVVMLPFVLLIVAWWQRGRIGRKDIYRAAPSLALAVAFGLVTYWFQHNRAISGEIIRTDGLPARLAGAGWAVWFYLSKALMPYKLTFVYPKWQIDPSSVVSYLPIAALAGFLILFWRYRTSWGRPFLAGIGYYVITLLPVLGFIDIYFMRYSLAADHWQYTSIIGAIALVVGLMTAHVNRRTKELRIPATILAIMIVGGLSILTWRQGAIYTNIETLWRDTLAKNPSAWMAHNNLGMVLEEQRKYDEAIASYNRAMQLRPDLEQHYYNRGKTYAAMGNHAQAIQDYNRAIEIKPDYSDAYNNRALAYGAMGDMVREMQDYSRAIDLRPSNAEAYNNRGYAYSKKGDFANAMQDLTKAIELKPDYAVAHNNRGYVFNGMGDPAKALQDYGKAIELKPDYAQAYNNRGATFFMLKEYDRAWVDVAKHKQLGGTPNPAFIKALTQASGRSGP